MTKIYLLLVIYLVIAKVAECKLLFKQTSSTTYSAFQNFDRGKGDKVGGESCKPSNGVIALSKPGQSARAEVRGPGKIQIENGKKYYISWDFMISSTVTDNAIFQWKAYGSPMKQNYPIVIKFVDGVLNLMQFQDQAFTKDYLNVLFTKKLNPNQWHSQMIAIGVSDKNTGGTIEYWFDGVQQTLLKHGKDEKVWPCRTFDGTQVSPKFGIYGAFGTSITSSFKNLQMGETLQDMNYGKRSSLANSSKAAKNNAKSLVTKARSGAKRTMRSKRVNRHATKH